MSTSATQASEYDLSKLIQEVDPSHVKKISLTAFESVYRLLLKLCIAMSEQGVGKKLKKNEKFVEFIETLGSMFDVKAVKKYTLSFKNNPENYGQTTKKILNTVRELKDSLCASLRKDDLSPLPDWLEDPHSLIEARNFLCIAKVEIFISECQKPLAQDILNVLQYILKALLLLFFNPYSSGRLYFAETSSSLNRLFYDFDGGLSAKGNHIIDNLVKTQKLNMYYLLTTTAGLEIPQLVIKNEPSDFFSVILENSRYLSTSICYCIDGCSEKALTSMLDIVYSYYFELLWFVNFTRKMVTIPRFDDNFTKAFVYYINYFNESLLNQEFIKKFIMDYNQKDKSHLFDRIIKLKDGAVVSNLFENGLILFGMHHPMFNLMGDYSEYLKQMIQATEDDGRDLFYRMYPGFHMIYSSLKHLLDNFNLFTNGNLFPLMTYMLPIVKCINSLSEYNSYSLQVIKSNMKSRNTHADFRLISLVDKYLNAMFTVITICYEIVANNDAYEAKRKTMSNKKGEFIVQHGDFQSFFNPLYLDIKTGQPPGYYATSVLIDIINPNISGLLNHVDYLQAYFIKCFNYMIICTKRKNTASLDIDFGNFISENKVFIDFFNGENNTKMQKHINKAFYLDQLNKDDDIIKNQISTYKDGTMSNLSKDGDLIGGSIKSFIAACSNINKHFNILQDVRSQLETGQPGVFMENGLIGYYNNDMSDLISSLTGHVYEEEYYINDSSRYMLHYNHAMWCSGLFSIEGSLYQARFPGLKGIPPNINQRDLIILANNLKLIQSLCKFHEKIIKIIMSQVLWNIINIKNVNCDLDTEQFPYAVLFQVESYIASVKISETYCKYFNEEAVKLNEYFAGLNGNPAFGNFSGIKLETIKSDMLILFSGVNEFDGHDMIEILTFYSHKYNIFTPLMSQINIDSVEILRNMLRYYQIENSKFVCNDINYQKFFVSKMALEGITSDSITQELSIAAINNGVNDYFSISDGSYMDREMDTIICEIQRCHENNFMNIITIEYLSPVYVYFDNGKYNNRGWDRFNSQRDDDGIGMSNSSIQIIQGNILFQPIDANGKIISGEYEDDYVNWFDSYLKNPQYNENEVITGGDLDDNEKVKEKMKSIYSTYTDEPTPQTVYTLELIKQYLDDADFKEYFDQMCYLCYESANDFKDIEVYLQDINSRSELIQFAHNNDTESIKLLKEYYNRYGDNLATIGDKLVRYLNLQSITENEEGINKYFTISLELNKVFETSLNDLTSLGLDGGDIQTIKINRSIYEVIPTKDVLMSVIKKILYDKDTLGNLTTLQRNIVFLLNDLPALIGAHTPPVDTEIETEDAVLDVKVVPFEEAFKEAKEDAAFKVLDTHHILKKVFIDGDLMSDAVESDLIKHMKKFFTDHATEMDNYDSLKLLIQGKVNKCVEFDADADAKAGKKKDYLVVAHRYMDHDCHINRLVLEGNDDLYNFYHQFDEDVTNIKNYYTSRTSGDIDIDKNYKNFLDEKIKTKFDNKDVTTKYRSFLPNFVDFYNKVFGKSMYSNVVFIYYEKFVRELIDKLSKLANFKKLFEDVCDIVDSYGQDAQNYPISYFSPSQYLFFIISCSDEERIKFIIENISLFYYVIVKRGLDESKQQIKVDLKNRCSFIMSMVLILENIKLLSFSDSKDFTYAIQYTVPLDNTSMMNLFRKVYFNQIFHGKFNVSDGKLKNTNARDTTNIKFQPFKNEDQKYLFLNTFIVYFQMLKKTKESNKLSNVLFKELLGNFKRNISNVFDSEYFKIYNGYIVKNNSATGVSTAKKIEGFKYFFQQVVQIFISLFLLFEKQTTVPVQIRGKSSSGGSGRSRASAPSATQPLTRMDQDTLTGTDMDLEDVDYAGFNRDFVNHVTLEETTDGMANMLNQFLIKGDNLTPLQNSFNVKRYLDIDVNPNERFNFIKHASSQKVKYKSSNEIVTISAYFIEALRLMFDHTHADDTNPTGFRDIIYDDMKTILNNMENNNFTLQLMELWHNHVTMENLHWIQDKKIDKIACTFNHIAKQFKVVYQFDKAGNVLNLSSLEFISTMRDVKQDGKWKQIKCKEAPAKETRSSKSTESTEPVAVISYTETFIKNKNNNITVNLKLLYHLCEILHVNIGLVSKSKAKINWCKHSKNPRKSIFSMILDYGGMSIVVVNLINVSDGNLSLDTYIYPVGDNEYYIDNFDQHVIEIAKTSRDLLSNGSNVDFDSHDVYYPLTCVQNGKNGTRCCGFINGIAKREFFYSIHENDIFNYQLGILFSFIFYGFDPEVQHHTYLHNRLIGDALDRLNKGELFTTSDPVFSSLQSITSINPVDFSLDIVDTSNFNNYNRLVF